MIEFEFLSNKNSNSIKLYLIPLITIYKRKGSLGHGEHDRSSYPSMPPPHLPSLIPHALTPLVGHTRREIGKREIKKREKKKKKFSHCLYSSSDRMQKEFVRRFIFRSSSMIFEEGDQIQIKEVKI